MHRGEHEPILSHELFAAVQAEIAANAVARQIRLRGSAAILAGRLFDDRGNRMSPTHANKRGVHCVSFHERDGAFALLAGIRVGLGAGDFVRVHDKTSLLALADMGV